MPRKPQREKNSINEYRAVIDRILAKLKEVKRRKCKSFGAETHRFRLNPPLTYQEVSKFELTHQVKLPEGYRAFLTMAGNGGAGPYYGILPLERWNEAAPHDLTNYLSRPSPLRPDMEPGQAWEDVLGCPFEELFQGTLAVAHQGCAYYCLLVVTGEYRGKVIYVDLDRNGAPYFVHASGFLVWYERWLDELLAGFDLSGSFGFGLAGTEEELSQVILESSEVNLREDALCSFFRRPKLGDQAHHAIHHALHDEEASVRQIAVDLVGERKLTSFIPDVVERAGDAITAIRSRSLVSLNKLKAKEGIPVARECLQDENEQVVFSAICLLKDAKKLLQSDLKPLLSSPNEGKRGHATWAWSEAIRDASYDISRLILDPDSQVRIYAVRNMGRNNLHLLLARLKQEEDLTVLGNLIACLGNLRDKRSVEGLSELTKHPDAFIRQDTARALGIIGHPSAIPALESLRGDQTTPIRKSDIGFMTMTSSFTVAQVAEEALQKVQPWFTRFIRSITG